MTDYVIPSIATIRAEILTAWKNLEQDISTSRYSDAWIRAHADACALWGAYRYIKWAQAQAFPDTADSSHLEQYAALYGLVKTAATASASTSVRLTGTPGTVVASGLEMVHVDGTEFETSSGGTIAPGGTLNVTAISTTTGEIANKEAAETLSLTSPPAGVDATVTIMSSFQGGEDAETDAQLLARVLIRLRTPPAGGKATDYEQWALEVSGVAEAFVYPLRRGLGTCDVVPLTTATDRLPSAGLLTQVQTHVDAERPVTAYNTLVVAPDLVVTAVTATVWLEDGYEWAIVELLVEAAILAEFASLAPGDTLYLSQIETVISNITGVKDRTVSFPVANVVPTVSSVTIELVSPGVVTLTEGT